MPLDYVVPSTSTVINTTDEAARSFLQHNLVPYTDYSFQIDAFTSKGNGPNCTAFIVRTEEEGTLGFFLFSTGLRFVLDSGFELNKAKIRLDDDN